MASIPNFPKSPMSDRISNWRGRLVIDLLGPHEPFREAVDAVRERWGIEAKTMIAVPEERLAWIGTRPWDAPVYAPTAWPMHLPLSTLQDPDDASAGFHTEGPPESDLVDTVNRIRPGAGAEQISRIRFVFGEELAGSLAAVAEDDDTLMRAYFCRYLWWLDLRRLHDLFVPRACRVRAGDPAAHGAWDDFFSLCLIYNPPPDRLREFVSAAMAPLPALVNLPIVPVRDADEVEHATRGYYESLLTHLGDALASAGIDLPELRRRIEAEHPEMEERRWERRGRAVCWSHIVPDEYTTKQAVGEAFDYIMSDRQERGSHNKGPRRDPLLAVQIAIWRASYKMTVIEIAKKLRLESSDGDWELLDGTCGKKCRSPRVSDHATYGQELLAQRNSSAASFRSF